MRLLNEKLKQAKFNKNKINKKIEKIQDVKSGKISIININSYIIRILFITLFYISFLNISLNLKGYNYFIYVFAIIIIILSLFSILITTVIKKKIFSAYYYNFNIKKIFPAIIIFLGIGYFLNSHKKCWNKFHWWLKKQFHRNNKQRQQNKVENR